CRRRQGIRAQHRRSAGDRRSGDRQSGEVQQRFDRGISVHRKPLRCHAGAVVRRAGERDHQIGHQHALGIVRGQFPRQQVQRPGSRAARRRSLLRSAMVRNLRRSDPQAVATWSHHWLAPDITAGGPRILLRGFSNSQNQNLPRYRIQRVWSVRDDFTLQYEAAGTHALKLGGELLYHDEFTRNCLWCMGELTANSAAAPNAATMLAIFPDAFNADTWNLNALSSITTRYKVGVSSGEFNTPYSIPKYGAWAQDDWTIGPR